MKKIIVVWIILLALLLSGCWRQQKVDVDKQIKEPTEQQQSVVDVLPMVPQAVVILLGQADKYSRAGDYRQAILVLQRAIKISPQAPQVQQQLAESYLADGNYEQALYWSSLVVENGPSHGLLCEKALRTQALAAEMVGNQSLQGQALNAIEGCSRRAIEKF